MKRLIYIAIILINMVLLIPVFAQDSAGDIWFEPALSAVRVGSRFATEIHANTGTLLLGAYELSVTYDPVIVSPNVSIGNNSVEPGADGFVAGVNAGELGILAINGFDAVGTGPGEDLHILTINWIANAASQNSITLDIIIDWFVDPIDLLPIATTNAINGEVKVYVLGDVNDDSEITIGDALLVAQYSVDLEPILFTAPKEVGDVHGCDGIANILDALIIAQYYVGIVTELPWPPCSGADTPEPTPETTPTPTETPTPTPDKISSMFIQPVGYGYAILNNGLFDFDDIPANQRLESIDFQIINNGETNITFSNDPKMVYESGDFEVDSSLIPNEIEPEAAGNFKIKFISNATNNSIKTTKISLQINNFDFSFSVQCTSLFADYNEYKAIGTSIWVPEVNGHATVTVIAGGGGGTGGSSGYYVNTGSAGGGAGQMVIENDVIIIKGKIYEICVGDNGLGGFAADECYGNQPFSGCPGGSGSDGKPSWIIGEGINITANQGQGAIGGYLGGDYVIEEVQIGIGYPNGYKYNNTNPSDINSMAGGDNGNGHGYGGGIIDPNDKNGSSAPAYSGGGGGGGLPGYLSAGGDYRPPGKGGDGGTGYVKIEWIGFVID